MVLQKVWFTSVVNFFLACVFVSSRDAPTLAITTTDLPSGYPLVGGVLNLTSDRETGILVLLRLGDLRRVQEREEQEEREREEVGGPEPGEYDYDPDQGYARAVESDERWAECVEALFSAGAGGGD